MPRTCFAAGEAIHEGRLAGTGGAHERRQDARPESARTVAQQLQLLLAVALPDASQRCRIISHALQATWRTGSIHGMLCSSWTIIRRIVAAYAG